MSTVVYETCPPIADATLNAFFARSWPDHTARAYQSVLEDSLGYVCAFDCERLIGFVNVATDGDQHAFLLDPTVDPEYRRRGIGTALVRAAAGLAKDRGCKWLHVDYEARLAGFYERAGFSHTAAGLMRLDEREGNPTT